MLWKMCLHSEIVSNNAFVQKIVNTRDMYKCVFTMVSSCALLCNISRWTNEVT